MATASPLDTLAYAKKLEAAGVPAAEAEVHARALNEALATSVASRVDIIELRNHFDARFEGVDARFEAVDARFDNVDLKLAHLESRLEARIGSVDLKLGGKIETLQWMFGVMVALNGAVLLQLFLK